MVCRFRHLQLLIGLILAAALWQPALADNPTATSSSYVSIGVGDTVMQIVGQTSPGAFVTIADFTTIIGTTTSDADGLFSSDFPAQSEGIHKPSVYVRDTIGRLSETVQIPTSLYGHSITTVNFYMPPTFGLAVSTIIKGQILNISGQSLPLSTINLLIDQNFSLAVAVDPTGVWNASVDTAELSFGSHSVFAVSVSGTGEQSYATRRVFFNVVRSLPSPPPPTPPATTPPGPAPGPSPKPPKIPAFRPTPPISLIVPLILTPQSEVRLPLAIHTGSGPFTIRIDWGDGHVEEQVLDGFSGILKHYYAKPGKYSLQVFAADSTGLYRSTKVVLRVRYLDEVINTFLQAGILLFFVIFLVEHIKSRRRWKYAY